MDQKFKYLLFFILFICLFIILFCFLYNNFESMIDLNKNNIFWSRNPCNFVMNETLSDVLKLHNITENSSKWSLFFPCSYDHINDELNKMPVRSNAKYFIIHNADLLTAKDLLWSHVYDYHGADKTKTFMPSSYVLYNDHDIKKIDSDFDPSKIYIMKKNIQRQEGLKITNNKQDIINGKSNGYVIAQELLQNPYIIDGRKTNMRFYMLVVCNHNDYNVYVYNNGFMYYTKSNFEKNNMTTDVNITTGYIDRSVYDKNPLSHHDLRNYLDNPNRKNLSTTEKHVRTQGLLISEIYFNNIYSLLHNIMISYKGKLNGLPKFYNSTMFQLFGVDIAVNDELQPMIMEINKGPDMNAKDKRDSDIKHSVLNDVLKTVNVISNDNQNGFIKIL